MTNDELLRIIDQAAKDKVTSLDLSNREITELPPEIGELLDLTELNIRYNRLTTLPSEIGELINLTRLDIGDNQVTTLPGEIGNLVYLRVLVLESNQLLRLPIEISKLANLRWLFLGNNQITIFPVELKKLNNLVVLVLRENQLAVLPPEIGQLVNLRRLGLRHNRLTTIPQEIGKLTSLEELDLRRNWLTKLPLEIQKLTKLKELDLRDNAMLLINPEILELTHEPAKIIEHYLLHQTEREERVNPIERDRKEDSKFLDLSNKKLFTISPSILHQSGLIELNLRNNNLNVLPHEISQLNKLTKLDLGNNRFDSLSHEIWEMLNLTELDLGGNQLTQLPAEIGKLINLARLNLGGNQLTQLPAGIGMLKNLIELDLRNNAFSVFPGVILELKNLRSLHFLNNQLSIIPLEIDKLKKLKTLHLMDNQLEMIPSEIGNLTSLTGLTFKNNKISLLPPEIGKLTQLIELNLENNQLTVLPQEIRNLKYLTMLDLRGNPLPIPPEILELSHEPQKILNYYFQQVEKPKKPLHEAKVVIVGQGAVGKTSLIKRLLDDSFDPQESKTDGIAINHWNVTVDDTQIRLNLWDFGGQEIMHATHQFFLTKRSLYLLVLDSRLDEQENRVEYWLKLIQSFGGDSPIIVVCNKADEHDLDLNWRGLQDKYPTIKAFAKSVSCKIGTGLEEVKALITREVGQLEHIHDELMLSWFAVKSQLETMQADYISYHTYQDVCEAEEITNELSQQTLLGFLHDLGIVLHFQEHPVLEDTSVLNPEWVTKGVYQILNSYELFQNKGELEREALDRILDPQSYPRKKQRFILDMMRQFELCFEFDGADGKRFLVPDLLSKEEPDTGDWRDSLAFQYHYDVLPGSVISRFIVRMHVYISKRTYWRNGVVLASEDGQNRALVKADSEDKKMFIAVSGRPDTRRAFLEIIRAEFRKLHATIPRIMVNEKVPLPELPAVVVDYKHLLKLENHGIMEYFPEGADAPVNVEHLLDGIESKTQRLRQRDDLSDPDERSFAPRIEVNPTIQVHTAAQASSQVAVNVEFKQALNFLQGSLAELKEEILEVQPELQEDLDKLEQSAKQLEKAETKEEAAKSGALSKIRRFLKEANDTGTALGTTIKGIKGSYAILQDVAEYYNNIAQWCGMPVVPDLFLKK